MNDYRKVLASILSKEELKFLPAGFQRIGHVVILDLQPSLLPKAGEIAEVFLGQKGVRTVAIRESSVKGRYRIPGIRVIAGDPETETVHRENGCSFKLDVSRTMFSLGNLHERARIPKLVISGEVVVDLFAGVGQFSIPIATHAEPREVHAVELNPVAYRYLCENIRLNGVGDKVKPLLGDCSKVAPLGVADRVVMGILHVTHHYLPLAIRVLKPEGGIIHYHESVPSRLKFERPVQRIRAAAAGRQVEILNQRVVKRYAPGVDHVVVDARISQ
jgi:tRNA wybutosine-synthesizing protein 2